MRGVSKSKLDANNPSATYLDHDHRERENIRFFAVCPLLGQDLRRSPSRGVPLIIRRTSHRIQILRDRGEAKVRDPRAAGGIHKDIGLGSCQYGVKWVRKNRLPP